MAIKSIERPSHDQELVPTIIRPYEPSQHGIIAELWQKSLPMYPIASDHLALMLHLHKSAHFVILDEDRIVGFCSSDIVGDRGTITAIYVDPACQGRGFGTALLNHSREHLQAQPGVTGVMIGGQFPKFWPGVPKDLPVKDQDFFQHRGLREGLTSRDLYQSLDSYASPQYILDRAASAGITFAPLTASGSAECLTAQQTEFADYGGWDKAYEYLDTQNLHREIMVAFDKEGKQVGWTIMLSPMVSKLWEAYAFLPVVGGRDGVSGNGNTGLICCVGVGSQARKGGAGLAMVCAAVEEMKRRGIQGVFVDWVAEALWGWYGKVGFETWREYRSFQW